MKPNWEWELNNLTYKQGLEKGTKAWNFSRQWQTHQWSLTMLSAWKQYVNIFVIKFKRDNCQFLFLLASYSCAHESWTHNLILQLVLIPFELELIGGHCHFPSKIQRTFIVSTVQPDTYNNKQQKNYFASHTQACLFSFIIKWAAMSHTEKHMEQQKLKLHKSQLHYNYS